jgi:hypothetical protein
MAKRRKEKSEEEELDFKFPKFDEEKFVKKERRNIKATFISFLFGIILAIISFGFWSLLRDNPFRWELVLLFGVFNASWLKYLFIKLNIDLTEFGKGKWLSAYATYFFTWFIVMLVIVNPPFYDDEAPVADVVLLPGIQEPGGTVKIIGRIMDNIGVKDVDFRIISPEGSTQNITNFNFEDEIFTYVYEYNENVILDSEYTYKIKVTDVNGFTSEKEGNFKYSKSTIVLTTPENKSDLHSYTPIEFRINENVYEPSSVEINGITYNPDFRVYYRIDQGLQINVSRLEADNRETYRTTAEYIGWQQEDNVTLNAYVEVVHYFPNLIREFNNTIKDTDYYQFETLDDPAIGQKDKLIPPISNLPLNDKNQPSNILNYYVPGPQLYAVPGFELLAFVVSVCVVALIFKYRKKDKSRKQ